MNFHCLIWLKVNTLGLEQYLESVFWYRLFSFFILPVGSADVKRLILEVYTRSRTKIIITTV
jgi:hypothetical protein